MRKLRKYTEEILRAEAVLILSNKTYEYVGRVFGIPLSTVGWHMLVALKDIDPYLWRQIRSVTLQHKGARRR